jgi:hypothetical protein
MEKQMTVEELKAKIKGNTEYLLSRIRGENIGVAGLDTTILLLQGAERALKIIEDIEKWEKAPMAPKL